MRSSSFVPVLILFSLATSSRARAQNAPSIFPTPPVSAPPATPAPAVIEPASVVAGPPVVPLVQAPPVLSGSPRLTAWHRHPIKPTVALSANQDGSNTVKTNVTFQWDHVSPHFEADHHEWAAVRGLAFAPTFSASDNTKQGLFSIGAPGGATPTFGSTSFSLGLLGAYTRYASIETDELTALFAALAKAKLPAGPVTADDVAACETFCASGANYADCKSFNNPVVVQVRKTPNPERNIDRGSLCAPVLAGVAKRFDAFLAQNPDVQRFVKLREQRFQFPSADLSLWGGLGASRFAYYEQQTALVGTTLPTYTSTTQWHPNGGAAIQLSAVPLIDDEQPHGFTIEALAVLKAAYQANSATGMGCTGNLGTVTSDKLASASYLGQCGTTQSIGGPTLGTTLVVEGYVGWVDIDNYYGRFAIGGGVDQNFGKSLTTWSIKVPAYLNGTAVAKDSSSGGAKNAPVPGGIQAFSYDGIVRLTPTVMYTVDPSGKKSGWGFAVGVDLIANHNLFTRADNLVK